MFTCGMHYSGHWAYRSYRPAASAAGDGRRQRQLGIATYSPLDSHGSVRGIGVFRLASRLGLRVRPSELGFRFLDAVL
jgi:hypothetical protein